MIRYPHIWLIHCLQTSWRDKTTIIKAAFINPSTKELRTKAGHKHILLSFPTVAFLITKVAFSHHILQNKEIYKIKSIRELLGREISDFLLISVPYQHAHCIKYDVDILPVKLWQLSHRFVFSSHTFWAFRTSIWSSKFGRDNSHWKPELHSCPLSFGRCKSLAQNWCAVRSAVLELGPSSLKVPREGLVCRHSD